MEYIRVARLLQAALGGGVSVGGESVAIKAEVVNRARLSQGLGRMDLYRLAKCDPRVGGRALRGGRVHISVVRRLAGALGLPVSEIIDLDAIAEPVSRAKSA